MNNQDLIGNTVNVGDLVLVAEKDMMPSFSKIEKISGQRCYFPLLFSNRHMSYTKDSFRAFDQIISLTALNIPEEMISCKYRCNDGFMDIAGTILEPGMKVVGIANGNFHKGIVEKLTDKTCFVNFSGPKATRTFSTYLLAYEVTR